ncbi:helix-turn-helix domain-containing protein [Nocardia sp. SYP-A9097]|uniref:helix-turn-helix domain-containing protein n=1 Tax=Nocardia sp. SYP-A9097 TaxID=2663237 RepID=UPI00129B84F3|nr:helix-turn-helix transcriptional regulator [Nocardia sp. SYP-A9097]MRH90888.1 helix-turn-helix domain-containing protein [Nocardia sp. SYP-A9097]
MAGSSLPRRALGRTLRRLRERAQKSQLAAGLTAEISPQSISRLEEGYKVRLATSQLKELLNLYDVADPGSERDEILSLWQEVKEQDQAAKIAGTTKGWWRAYSDQYFAHFDHYLSLETAANHITTHQLALVPGLFQIPDYRRAIVRTAYPDLSPVDVERRVELTVRRQERLQDSTFRIDALLSEAVVRSKPTGSDVMAQQLLHLAELSERPSISIRMIPLDAESPLWLMVQAFTLLEFPPLASRVVEPPIVFVEGYEGALFLEQDTVIDRYRRAIGDIQRLALSEDDTRTLVRRIAKEHAA